MRHLTGTTSAAGTPTLSLVLRGTAITLALAGVAGWAVGWFDQPVNGAPRLTLENAAPSSGELVGRFLAALAANDRDAIEQLRINQNEYLQLILPGSVAPDEALQVMPEKKAEFFFGYLDTRSRYSLKSLMTRMGGKPLELVRIDVPKIERYRWYTALRDPVLHVKYGGKPVEIRLGSIAEINGQFKFISYYVDD
jgi:hypothetical protein